MNQYSLKELPNIDQPEVLDLLACTEELRHAAKDLAKTVLEQRPENARITPTVVCLQILARAVENSVSCQLLASKGRSRDLAILLLSLYERCLDIQFIALRTGREEVWLAHVKENTKPWKVHQQIEELFSDRDERDAEFYVYRHYSMVKHCNPSASTFAFPIAVRGHVQSGTSQPERALFLKNARADGDLIGLHLFVLGACLCKISKAAINILRNEGFELTEYEPRLETLEKELGILNERQVIITLGLS
jgi:hypothetical protein